MPSDSRRRSKKARCHNCEGFSLVRSECVCIMRNQDKDMKANFTNNESSSDNQSEKSTCKESGKYVAFCS